MQTVREQLKILFLHFFSLTDKHAIDVKVTLPIIHSIYFAEIKSLTGQNMIYSAQKAWVELSNPSKKVLGNRSFLRSKSFSISS